MKIITSQTTRKDADALMNVLHRRAESDPKLADQLAIEDEAANEENVLIRNAKRRRAENELAKKRGWINV